MPAKARGFTLVEVMVALTILSLVLLGTVTALRTLGNTQASLERATERVDEMRSVTGFLRDLLDTAVIGSNVGGLTLGGGVQESTYFRATANFVEWKARLLFGESFGGTYVVRVAREGQDLVLRWMGPEQLLLDDVYWEKAPSRVLVSEVEEYSVALKGEFQGSWETEWQDTSLAPALVRMQVKAGGRYWPELIMSVQR